MLFGATYLLTIPLTASASARSPTGSATGQAAIPVFGPMVILVEHKESLTTGGNVFYFCNFFVQALGVGLAVKGIAKLGSPHPRPAAAGLTVLPALDVRPGVATGGFVGSF